MLDFTSIVFCEGSINFFDFTSTFCIPDTELFELVVDVLVKL